MNPDSEINLVEAAQKGDIESFGMLYEKYYSSIAALAFSILADRQLAEDAAQETFAAACFKIGSLKSKEKFAPWLAGICRNVSRQMLRTTKIKLVTTVVESVAASSRRDGDGTQAAVKQALENLKEAERELIVMRYFDNLPYEKIASVLDISEQAVHGRLIRTKRKIAKYLKRNGVTGDNYE
ncbi:MAG: sigma-70 family RNA polymerase sigma factor [Sedimentisphaerales bacterium]|nr:sigma-70 family RNA polymerase sigma factor [Sedimentisphaerales bacterium]